MFWNHFEPFDSWKLVVLKSHTQPFIRKLLSTHQYGLPPVVQVLASAGSSVLEESDIFSVINTVIQH